MTVTISRLYNNYDDARAAVRNLESAGIAHNDISIIASNADNWYSDDRKADTYPDRDLDGKDDRAEGAGAGAGIGATVGGAAGFLAGLGIMAIPGVGPVVAAGWLAATLAGAAAGGLTGGVVGALTQAGVSKEDADIYAEGLRRGGAVVSARVPDRDASRLQALIDRSAVNIAERGTAYRQAGWQSFDPKAHALYGRPDSEGAGPLYEAISAGTSGAESARCTIQGMQQCKLDPSPKIQPVRTEHKGSSKGRWRRQL